mgnify:CR=1 FL=1
MTVTALYPGYQVKVEEPTPEVARADAYLFGDYVCGKIFRLERRGARVEGTAFYSRRGDGPYYRWLYAEGAGRWRYSRVSLDKPALRVLCLARWDAVPAALREGMVEHWGEAPGSTEASYGRLPPRGSRGRGSSSR